MEERSRRVLILMLTAVTGLVVACSDKSVNNGARSTDFVASEPFDYAIEAAGHTGIDLQGVNCEINLTSAPGLSSVSITGTRRVGSDSYADAEEYLRLLTVSVDDSGDRIAILVEQPSNTEWRSFNVEFDIDIPRDYDIDFEIVNGTVTLDSLEASAQISAVNCDIYFGRIFGECNMQIVNGQIHGASVFPAGGSSAFSVVNGVVDIDIPQNTSAEFSASVVNGGISIRELVFRNYHETPNSVTGTLGAGDGSIAMSVVNGNISVEGY